MLYRPGREKGVPLQDICGDTQDLGLYPVDNHIQDAGVLESPKSDVPLLAWLRVVGIGRAATYAIKMLQLSALPQVEQMKRDAPLAEMEVAKAPVIDMTMGGKPYIQLDVADMVEERQWLLVGHGCDCVRASEDVKRGPVEYWFCFSVDLLARLEDLACVASDAGLLVDQGYFPAKEDQLVDKGSHFCGEAQERYGCHFEESGTDIRASSHTRGSERVI